MSVQLATSSEVDVKSIKNFTHYSRYMLACKWRFGETRFTFSGLMQMGTHALQVYISMSVHCIDVQQRYSKSPYLFIARLLHDVNSVSPVNKTLTVNGKWNTFYGSRTALLRRLMPRTNSDVYTNEIAISIRIEWQRLNCQHTSFTHKYVHTNSEC